MDLDLLSCARFLQNIIAHNAINQGKQLHLVFLKRGVLQSAVTIGNRLLQMYSRCGYLGDARKLFDEMPQRNCFTWNSMIEGYMRSGHKGEWIDLFSSMPHKNDFSWNLVILGFLKANELSVARRFFDEMPWKNGEAWNSMIHGYAKNGRPMEAVRLFKDLKTDRYETGQADVYVLTTVIGACTDLLALHWGKQIHARIVVGEVESDSVLGSSLVNMYGKCGDLDSASLVLNASPNPDDFSLSALISGYANCGRIRDAERIFRIGNGSCVVLWNSLIGGYMVNGMALEALFLFGEMRRHGILEDASTFGSILSACANLCIPEYGKQMHAHAYKSGIVDDLIVASALLDAYAKCGSPHHSCQLFSELGTYDTVLLNSMITIFYTCGRVEDAKRVFQSIPSKTLISWNSMIVGLNQNGCPIEALSLFREMNKMGLAMDRFSLASMISTCANISSLEFGEQLFGRATIVGLELDKVISTSLVDLYCKCGLVDHGRRIFDQIVQCDEASWNSMLMGYATNGYGNEALELFSSMRNLGVQPTDITFTAVLSACDHCGLVEEGEKWFYAMKHDYHIDPGIEHYACILDLFARAGRLDQAMNLIEEMPFEADSSMWSSVLRGCLVHGDGILGKKVAEKIIAIDPKNSDAYVQLSSIFATCGEWDRSAEVRKLMRAERIMKKPGRSWGEL